MARKLDVNGKVHEAGLSDGAQLLWVLRDNLGPTGTKYGSGIMSYEASTVSRCAPVARQSRLPDVGVRLVDNSLDRPTGVGEPGVPPFLPALAAAVCGTTGQDIIAWPMKRDGYAFLAGAS